VSVADCLVVWLMLCLSEWTLREDVEQQQLELHRKQRGDERSHLSEEARQREQQALQQLHRQQQVVHVAPCSL